MDIDMTSVAGDTDIGDDSVSVDTGFVSEHSHHLVRFCLSFSEFFVCFLLLTTRSYSFCSAVCT